ncbi:MAG: CHRD domain-containing protein [Halobacteria archaeon]|nr:CHRD domain-containing protein [Halobacteria archaeon]
MKTTLALSLFALTLYAGSVGAANELEFEAELSGAQEVPPVDTRVKGEASFEVNDDYSKIEYSVKVKTRGEVGVGLLGAACAHIHCAPEGQNGPVVAFLAGVVSGGFDGTVKFSATLTGDNIVNDACGATIVDLVNSMSNGLTYVNVHSLANPTGEVRGQIRSEDD